MFLCIVRRAFKILANRQKYLQILSQLDLQLLERFVKVLQIQTGCSAVQATSHDLRSCEKARQMTLLSISKDVETTTYFRKNTYYFS